MRTPPIDPKIIATLPIFFSTSLAAVLLWYADAPELTMPFVLGIVAGGLVDLDNGLTGRIKNIAYTAVVFSISSLSVQWTLGTGWLFIAVWVALTFVFTMLGAAGMRYRTIAFGALAVAAYTTLTYQADSHWWVNPVLILLGTLLYSCATLLLHLLLPHRPVQENMAAAYAALGAYFDAKAEFFDPDEAEGMEGHQIDLAMQDRNVTEVFNLVRSALFYRMRGQHRHPRTTRMLRYYFIAQDIHERITSTHADYRELADRLKHTDLIFRIHRLLELQAQACRDVAESLRADQPYQYSPRLARAIAGCQQSLKLYAEVFRGGASAAHVHTLHNLLANFSAIDYQLSHLTAEADMRAQEAELGQPSERSRIAALEQGGWRGAWRNMRAQFNLESSVFRHAVRLCVVVVICCAIVDIFQLEMGYWILLTGLFVCQPNYSVTRKRVAQRIAGTVLGVIAASLTPYFTPSVATKLWLVIASTTLFFFFRTNKHSFSTFFLTIQALMGMSLMGMDIYAAMPVRILDTLVGAAIAWLAVWLLWPDWHYLTLGRSAEQSVASNGAYLHQIVEQLRTGASDDVAYRSVRRQAHEKAAQLSSTLSDMSSEPGKYGQRLQDGMKLLKISHAMIGYISALGAYRSDMLREAGGETSQTGDGGDGGGPTFAEQYFSAAHRVADMLQNITRPDAAAFAQALEDIGQELQQLQIAAGEDRQSRILWQQLDLIAGQIGPCRAILDRVPPVIDTDETSPAMPLPMS